MEEETPLIARKSIEYLWNISHEYSTQPALSRHYLEDLNETAISNSIGLAKMIRSQFCNFCEELFIPGVNCSVRVQSTRNKNKEKRKKMIIYNCLSCKKKTSFPGREANQLAILAKSAPTIQKTITKKQEKRVNISAKATGVNKSTMQATNTKSTQNQSNIVSSSFNPKSSPNSNKNRKKKNNTLLAEIMKKNEQAAAKGNSPSLSDFLQSL